MNEEDNGKTEMSSINEPVPLLPAILIIIGWLILLGVMYFA